MGTLIPEYVAGCDFKTACDQHDRCYGRCDRSNCPGQLNANKCAGNCAMCDPRCPKSRQQRRKVCDAQLTIDIVRNNSGRCEAAAYAYSFAVSAAGCWFFRGFGPLGTTERQRRLKETFQSNFDAAYARAKADPGVMKPAIAEPEKRAVREVGEVVDMADYKLVVDHAFRRPILKLKKKGMNFRGFGGARDRVLLNGVDVTDVTVSGKMFDLNEVRKARPDFDTSGLKQKNARTP